jgi:Domain of unknown function (DUF4845)
LIALPHRLWVFPFQEHAMPIGSIGHYSHLYHTQRRPNGQRAGHAHAASRAARVPRGLTLIGLLFWAGMVACLGYLVVRVAPTLTEYRAISRLISDVAATNPTTVAEARANYDKQREVEFGINAVTGKDLNVTKVNDKVVIGFSYDKEVPLYGPVRLLIKFEGLSSD